MANSITLSKEILTAIDRVIGTQGNRSKFIETILQDYLTHHHAAGKSPSQDLDILNACASDLNAEAKDVLTYQVPL